MVCCVYTSLSLSLSQCVTRCAVIDFIHVRARASSAGAYLARALFAPPAGPAPEKIGESTAWIYQSQCVLKKYIYRAFFFKVGGRRWMDVMRSVPLIPN